jgi:hypothetical protein
MSTNNEKNYDKLLADYKKVCNELDMIKKEYQENTIIQSMNDMKKIYNEQKMAIDKLYDIIDRMHDRNKAIKIMLSNLSQFRRIENIHKHDFKVKIEFIQEILNENLQTKNELYSLDYPI